MNTIELIHTISVGATVWFLIIWIAYIISIESRLSKGLLDEEDMDKANFIIKVLITIIAISALTSLTTLVLMVNSHN